METNDETSLIERSHKARDAFIRAKNRGDLDEAERHAKFIEYVNNRLRKELQKGHR